MQKDSKKNKKEVRAEKTEEFKCEDSIEEVIQVFEQKSTEQAPAKPISSTTATKKE